MPYTYDYTIKLSFGLGRENGVTKHEKRKSTVPIYRL